ncbi:hypothetical protein [Microbacterium sp. NPDC056736]|uniref:hypothetical protein n=1 Tax=Microbacterium sp. NPDC056736 TaxID=3345932 RepID=UPI003672DBDA
MGSGGIPREGALEAELSALRTRAYGVDADIDSDPAALARLAELEQLHAAATSAGHEPEPLTRGAEPPSPSSGDLRGPGARAWWRRTRGGALAAGAAMTLAAVLAVLGWMWWTAPRPDATLQRTDAAPSEQVLRLADYARRQLVMKSTLRAFEPVLGLEVWSAQSTFGSTCLLIFEPASDELLAIGCAPAPAEPIAEIYDVPVEWNEEWVDRFPTGTVVRFMKHGDAVDVWIHEGAVPAVPPAP